MLGRPRVLQDKQCPVCLKIYRPVASKLKTCSMKCSLKVRPKKGLYKTCLYCKKQFYVSQVHKNQRCCKQEHTIKLAKQNAFRFSCKVCGKTVFTQPAQIKYRSRKHCSRKCASISMHQAALERSKVPGLTKHQLNRLARYSLEARQWRKAVFERDDYTCQMCGQRGGYLEADHIKPFAYFEDLRYELSNGRTLCRPCHDKTKIPANKLREKWGIKLSA